MLRKLLNQDHYQPISTSDNHELLIMSVEPKKTDGSGVEEAKVISPLPDLVTISEDDFSRLTLYEKKATLINQEMDRMGFGR